MFYNNKTLYTKICYIKGIADMMAKLEYRINVLDHHSCGLQNAVLQNQIKMLMIQYSTY